MGPWLCSHGNGAWSRDVIRAVVLLQWGRGCVATEMRVFRRIRSIRILASMGPWLCSHGNPAVSTGSAKYCGQLQWGRGCVATEMAVGGPGGPYATGLQWGRGCVATEIPAPELNPAALRSASMGPWLCSHGNLIVLDAFYRFMPASMGPWLCSHGN